MMTKRGIWSGPQFKMLMLLAVVTVLLSLVSPSTEEPYGGGGGGGVGGYFGANAKCPRLCSCTGTTVDCTYLGLTQVPRKIPPETDILFHGEDISHKTACAVLANTTNEIWNATNEMTDASRNHICY